MNQYISYHNAAANKLQASQEGQETLIANTIAGLINF
jgi:hypothetical protein